MEIIELFLQGKQIYITKDGPSVYILHIYFAYFWTGLPGILSKKYAVLTKLYHICKIRTLVLHSVY
jgi:hypothetical protein